MISDVVIGDRDRSHGIRNGVGEKRGGVKRVVFR